MYIPQSCRNMQLQDFFGSLSATEERASKKNKDYPFLLFSIVRFLFIYLPTPVARTKEIICCAEEILEKIVYFWQI